MAEMAAQMPDSVPEDEAQGSIRWEQAGENALLFPIILAFFGIVGITYILDPERIADKFQSAVRYLPTLRMNAITFYSELVNWSLNHVTDRNMFIIQSALTCGAVIWFVHSLRCTCRQDRDADVAIKGSFAERDKRCGSRSPSSFPS
jgi:hypothetical protein